MKTSRTLFAVLAAAVALSGCGGDDGPAEPPSDEPEAVEESSWQDEANALCTTMTENVEQVGVEHSDDPFAAALGMSAELAELATGLEGLEVPEEEQDAVAELQSVASTAADSLADAATEEDIEMAILEFGTSFSEQAGQLGLDSCAGVLQTSDPDENVAGDE